MSAYKDTDILPFLRDLEKNWKPIQEEVAAFEQNFEMYHEAAKKFLYPNPSSSLPKTQGWLTLGFFVQRMSLFEFLKKYHFTAHNENPSDEELAFFCKKVEGFHQMAFPRTREIFKEFFEANREMITNIAIFRLDDDMFLPVHTNYDPHMYRCHMGVIVPEGDIGMLVEGEERVWEEGKFLVFDSMMPHTVWNYTGKARYIVNVDCFRPDCNRKDVHAVFDALLGLRMNESKLTMGLSGGRFDMPLDQKRKYASRHEQIG